MASNFPTTLDTLTNPQATDKTDSPSHAGQHSDLNDAVEAIQAKVGVNSSAVNTSLDYKVTNASSSNPGHKHTLAHGATDVTASAAEVNILDGVTATTAELNILDGVTSTAAELNITDGGDTTNKVLNKQIKCRVYLSAGQNNITHASFVKILFNTESYDIGGNFDTTNSRFTAPVTGYYDVKLNVIANSAEANRTYYALIYANGSAYQQDVMSNGSGTLIGVDTNALVYVTAGQYIEGYVYFDSAGDGVDIVSGAINTVLTITLDSV